MDDPKMMRLLQKFDDAKKGNLACPLDHAKLQQLIGLGLLRENGIAVEVTEAGRKELDEFEALWVTSRRR